MSTSMSNKNATHPLISAVSAQDTRPASQSATNKSRLSWFRCFFKCSMSKGILLILLWNMLVGFTYGMVEYTPVGMMLLAREERTIPFHSILSYTLAAYAVSGLVQMSYPIGGLLADLRCGRFAIVKMSLVSIWVGFIFMFLLGLSYIIVRGIPSMEVKISESVGGVIVFVLFILGFSGFQSNAVQFGLDQLPDASSEELSMFLHWYVWTECVGEMLPRLLSAASICDGKLRNKGIGYLTYVFFGLSTMCVIMICYKHHWFNCENVVGNPYRNVYRVLKFAAKHGKPLGHRSALTYSDDIKPSRIDFAKQKYGGIFTTEVVEDVKTFLRILLMLLAITPMFYFEVSTSYLFPIYGLHLGMNVSVNGYCTYEWILIKSGSLSTLISVVGIPLYTIIAYSHIRKWVPRIVHRMAIGIVTKVLLVIAMFIMQVIASYAAHGHGSQCLFLSEYRNGKYFDYSPTLEFPKQIVYIAMLSLLNGIASPLINITVLEFISAQSPHTMKGLLLGVFYAFRGLFITLGCVATFPFAQEKLWGDHHGIFDCGFYYYLSNSVLGVIGLVVFLMAASRYRNRERDDPPYTHQYAEDYYSRYASRPTTMLVEEEVETYGTIS